MKILLLTDIPPCKNLTAGLVLDQLCRFLPRGSLVCFAVTNPDINPRLSPDLDWIPIEYVTKPKEYAVGQPLRSRMARQFLTACREELNLRFSVPALVEQAVAFGRQHKVDAVWAVLQGQTILRMALPLSDTLRVPLFTHVWDPLSWWLVANDMDRHTSRIALGQFDRTLRGSRACAAASWAMAEQYERDYGTHCVPVMSSHDRRLAASPPACLNRADEVVIGIAGQFYALEEWLQLVAALKAAKWRVAGREVRLKVLGHYVPNSGAPEERIEFLGWRAQSEAIQILSGMDLLYCPYPFARHMEEVSRLSFPSKVVTYLAAGRPILFHGPASSSPARYLASKHAAFLAKAFDAPSIYNEIQRAVENPELYERVAANGRAAFLADFTLERMKECLYAFLEVSETQMAEQYRNYVAEVPAVLQSRFASLSPHLVIPRRILKHFALKVPAVRNLQRYARQVEAERDKIGAQLDAMGQELHRVYAYSGSTTAERDRLGQRLEAMGAELHLTYQRSGQLSSECAAAHARLSELEAEQVVKSRRTAENEARMKNLEDHLANAMQRGDTAIERAGVLETELSVARAQRDYFSQAHEALNATYRSDTSAMSTRIGALEAELGALVRHGQEIAERNYREMTALGERAAALEEERAVHLAQREETQGRDFARVLGKLSLLEYRIDEKLPNISIPTDGRSDKALNSSSLEGAKLYLDLIEASLVGTLSEDPGMRHWGDKFDADIRSIGRDWPSQAQTMIGTVRMRNVRHLAERVLTDGVPGDFIETGVWRGGACIYMRAILAAYGVSDRKVWVADSFCGLPRPNPDLYPADTGDKHHSLEELAVSLESVKTNFQRYGLLDERVEFLPGWFKDTLPDSPVRKLALLRLDGDMYESTIQALDALYWKVSPGGFVIIDDYILPGCRKAVDDFRLRHDIDAELEEIDAAAVHWRKSPE